MNFASSNASDIEAAHLFEGRSLRERLPIRPTVLDWLATRARSENDAPYMTFVSGEREDATLSYRALDVLSDRLAGWLTSEIGVRAGSVVGLIAINDKPTVLAVFAILKAGAAILFQNPEDPPARVRQQCEALGVTTLLHSPALRSETPTGAMPVPDAAELPEPAARDRDQQPLADAFYFGTSGSTAVSKLVAQSHYNAAVNAEALRRHHALSAGDRFLGCLPIHHVNGLHFTIMGTLAAGAHAILARNFEPLNYPRLMATYSPKVASVVPPILDALAEVWRGAPPPSEFRYFVSAAAPMTRETAQAVHDRLGVRVLQGYGLTETVNFSATMPRGLSDDAYASLTLNAETPSIGAALYGNEMVVLRPDLTRAAPGEVGEICMRGHNVMMRYAGNDDATAEAFRGGWFHSQDLGFETLQEGRRFFVITGRLKNIAKVGGRAVSLEEMDRALRTLPQVVDAACVAMPDRLLGEKIIAAVVLSAPLTDAELREPLANLFSRAVLPTRFERLAKLPRTLTGKILRAKLAELLSA